MSRINIKNLTMYILILLVILSYSFGSFSKTIDLNGVSISINATTNKSQTGDGIYINDNEKFSDKEYKNDKKETKDTKDTSVLVELSIKNTNPYEACNISVTEKVNSGFKQKGNIKFNKTINLKLSPYETKTYKYNYKYNKNFLREQFNKFLTGNSENIGAFSNDKKFTLSERDNKEDVNEKINLIDNAKVSEKRKSRVIFVILIIVFTVIIIGLMYYMYFIRIKDKENEYIDSSFSKYNNYEDFNVIIITFILSIIVSICFNNKLYALEYTPHIYEKGKSFTKEITESVVFNERYFNFTYVIDVKFENKNEITDFEIDTDNDGLVDALEYVYMTDKENVDTDGDGISDYLEVMVLNYNPKSKWTFNDGINDGYRDFDGDGLRNIKEIEFGTDPILYDTDGDNLSDYDEISGVKSKDGKETYTTNPILVDTDGDGLNDDLELELGLNPTTVKTDGVIYDFERKIMQELKLSNVPNSLINCTFPIVSVKSSFCGDINTSLKIKEYRNENLYNSGLIVGEPISIVIDDKNKDAKVNISIDCSFYADRIKSLTFIKYVYGKMEVMETKVDGNNINANLENGNYGIIDVEHYLRKLNIYKGDY